MSLGDKFKAILGLPEDGEAEDEREDVIEEVAGQRPKARVSESPSYSGSSSKMQFILVKPEKYDECVQIGNHLMERKTVVLNLESTGKEVSRRIVDFLGGVAFAMRGQIKKVSIATYIIIPTNADISGDVLDEIESGGVFF
jgi:cell division inhibitor SepF